MNIPIYRAKKIDSDEYVEGFLYQDIIEYVQSDGINIDEYKKALDINSWYIMNNLSMTDMIDKTTLAIHFPDMLDNQGNKIFASLSEDGKGGDITELQVSSGTCLSCGDKLPKTLAVAIYEQMEFREIELNPHKCFRKRENNYMLIGSLEYKKVIGIQKWKYQTKT